MILGIDKGTTYTKSSEGIIIRSTMREDDNDILIDKSLSVKIFDNKYIIGEAGNYSTDLMKSTHDNTKILSYTIIGLSTQSKYIETDMVIGLPIALYGKQKNTMKDLFNNDTIPITINGYQKHIKIKRVEVFPEAAGAFYSQSEENALVIDNGGLSIDTALFQNGKLQKYSTYSMGIMKLYSKIANKINSQFDLSLGEWDIPGVLENGLYIYGQQVKLNINDLIKDHTKQITSRLKMEYDLKAIRNVLLTGGGSILLWDYLLSEIPQSRLLEGQLDNAKGFKKVGESLFR